MTRKFFSLLALMTIVISSAFIVSCGEETSLDDDDSLSSTIKGLMDDGIRHMSNGRYTSALDTFDEILKLDPNYKPARFGWSYSEALAQIDDVVSTAATLLTTIAGAFGKNGSFQPQQVETAEELVSRLRVFENDPELRRMVEAGLIDSAVRSFLTKYYVSLQKINMHMDEVASSGSFEFEIESLPISFLDGLFQIGNLGGRYTQVEALTGSAITKLILGVFEILFSIDLGFSLSGDNISAAMSLFNGDVELNVENVLGFAAYFVEMNKAFLNINSGGEERMQTAGTVLGEAAANVKNALTILSERTSHNSNNLFQVTEEDGGQKNLSIKLDIIDIADLGDDKFDLPITEDLLTALDHVENNLLNDQDAISWAEDIAPAISAVVVALLKTDFIQGLILGMISDSASEGGDNPLASLESILNSGLLSADFIHGLLVQFVPDLFRFDLGAFFKKPVPFRNFLPVAYVVPMGSTGLEIFKSRFLFEWECSTTQLNNPDNLVAGVICPLDPTKLTDIEHFPSGVSATALAPYDDSAVMATFAEPVADIFAGLATKYPKSGYDSPIAKDEQLSSLPYIPFKDPTFGNMLVLRTDELDDSDNATTGWGPGNNWKINAMLAQLVGGVLGLVGELLK